MKKYIYYTKINSTGILISDNAHEPTLGYTLGWEIETDCFDEVLKYMRITENVPLSWEGGKIQNMNISGFKNEFIRCMGTYDELLYEGYIIKEYHKDDKLCIIYAKCPVKRFLDFPKFVR